MTTPASLTAPMEGTLAQWLLYLEQIHPSAIDMGLDRVAAVAVKLNIDLSPCQVITVGGTNGKGTTCAFIEQALRKQDKQVGVYSSPHLLDYRERVRINGVSPDETEFCQAFKRVEQARQDITLTYFEFGTLAALVMLQAAKLDTVLLEVGLGGRLDATNIIDSDIAVITSIDLDHQDWLGDTREAIATEKAGIMRQNGKVVVGEPNPPQPLRDIATQLSAKVLWAGEQFYATSDDSGWYYHLLDQSVGPLPEPQLVKDNVMTALAVLHSVDALPSERDICSLIESVTLPGRRQQLRSQPKVIVDVGHNPHATRSLALLVQQQSYQRLHLVCAMLADKALAETLSSFADIAAHWYLGSTTGPRGLSSAALKNALHTEQSTVCCESIVDAYHAALEDAQEDDMILVFGSFHTVADVLALQNTP